MNQLWIFLSTYSGIKLEVPVVIIALLIAVKLQKSRLFRVAIMMTVFIVFRLVGEAIKLGVAAPRPCWQVELPSLIACPDSFAFPSGHALGSMMAAVILGLIFKKKIVWVISMITAVLISYSRVATGVHWPVDVIGGGLLGLVFGLLGWRFYWR